MGNSLEIIEAVNKIHTSVNNGFKGVYDKIDEKFGECEKRSDICDRKVFEIEKQMAIKKALQKQMKENRRKDYWAYIARAITIAGIIALLSITKIN